GTIVVSVALTTCSIPPSILEQVLASGELRVLTRNSPATFYYGADEPLGIDYELAKGYAEHLGVRLNIEVADRFWQIFPDVASGRVHVGAAGLTVTKPRAEIVDFSPAYQTVRQAVIYRRGNRKPRDLRDLLGARIEVLAGSTYVGLLQDASAALPELNWVENSEVDIEALVRRVAEGQIDFTIVDSNLFDLLQHRYPEAREAFAIGDEIPVAWALEKTGDTSLRESISAYFAEIQATGDLDAILDRYYFLTRKDFDYVGSRAFIRHFETRLPAYREHFLAAGERTNVDWRLLAAMAYQESHWDEGAVSPTGVKGIMMLTSTTADIVGVDDRTDPEQSIQGGADYFVRVTDKIPARIEDPDRTWLAVAAYNVGYGHLEDARVITESLGGNPDSWKEVRERLPLLTDPGWYEHLPRGYARGHEPVKYVDNVRRYYDILRWMTARESAGTEMIAGATTN
ncbi:MAG TPA: membrane-bound lytic murein transglycosylase MltF, partial [Gammaproteobacteria bacterium]